MTKNRNEVTSTELVWPGKETEVERVVLPFQTVETVNKPRVDQPRMDFGEWPKNYPRDWKNKLIWGDNKYVIGSLLRDFAGQIDLIYIDPPFATGADFTVDIQIGDAEVTKEASVIEELAYRDTWGKGMSSYLQMMYKRLVLMKELLAEDGVIYVHLDYRVGHYIKTILDEIFERDCFLNEVVWRREVARGMKGYAKYFGHNTDHLFLYEKSQGQAKWHRVEGKREVSQAELESDYYRDKRGYFTTSHRGTYSDQSIIELSKENRVFVTRGGELVIDEEKGEVSTTKGTIRIKYYLDRENGKYYKSYLVDNLWTDIRGIAECSPAERMDFPTQKPEELLRRIVEASSDEGDIVADFFCGSGTTGAVAEKLGRRWIMSDLSRFAIQTTRKRLLNLHDYSKDYDKPARPFEILNMGNYQKHKFIENKHPPVEQYIKFILELYRARPLEGLSFVHGKKGKRSVHVAGVDSIVTEREVRDTAEECVNALGGKAIDVLGWDFEMGLDELVGRVSEEYEADIKLVQIPREAMELRSADQDIRFFDMNYLDVAYQVEGKKLSIELKDFIIANSEYLPDEVRENVKSFSDYIDYWAVDFDYQEDTFHNMWQSFRTRKRKKLDGACAHLYDRPGRYQVLIKVIDVFGNDTNKLLEVKVG